MYHGHLAWQQIDFILLFSFFFFFFCKTVPAQCNPYLSKIAEAAFAPPEILMWLVWVGTSAYAVGKLLEWLTSTTGQTPLHSMPPPVRWMRRKQTATTKHTASQQQAPCFQKKTEKKGEKTELNFQQGETYSNMPVAGTERKGYVS